MRIYYKEDFFVWEEAFPRQWKIYSIVYLIYLLSISETGFTTYY